MALSYCSCSPHLFFEIPICKECWSCVVPPKSIKKRVIGNSNECWFLLLVREGKKSVKIILWQTQFDLDCGVGFFLANFKVERAGRPPSKNITIAPPTIFCPLVRRHGKKSSIMCQLILDGYYLAKHSHA